MSVQTKVEPPAMTDAAFSAKSGPASPQRVPASRGRDLTVGREPLAALAGEWEELHRRARGGSFFTTWTFLNTWWQHFRRQRRSRVYTVRDAEGRLVGVVPLYLEHRPLRLGRVSVLRNVGYGDVVNPDFLDAVVARGWETRVADLLRPVVLGDESWEYAEFSELDPEGALMRIARRWEASGALALRSERRCVCPFIDLPESLDAFLAGRNSHFRQQLRRYRRKIERDLDVQWKRVGVDVELAAGIQALASLHQQRMEATDRGGNFRKQEYLDFHRDLAQRALGGGELYFWLLFVEGSPIASHYGYLHGGVYFGYQMGFAPRFHKWSPGHYMTGVVLEKLIDAGAREMNLLRGTDGWKFRWTDTTRETVSLSLIRRDWRSSAAWIRANLSASPPIALRFLLGRQTFDELRSRLEEFRRRMAPASR